MDREDNLRERLVLLHHQTLTVERIEDRLVVQAARLMGVDPKEIDVRAPFASYGLLAGQASSLAVDLENWLGHPITLVMVDEHPTIRSLAGYLAHEFNGSKSDALTDRAMAINEESGGHATEGRSGWPSQDGDRETEKVQVYERSNLTQNQLLYWIAQQLQPGVTPFNVTTKITIFASVDINAFRQAFQTLINSSDALRTVIEEIDGLPQQRVVPEVPYQLEYCDFSGTTDPKRQFEEWALARSRIPFGFTEPMFDSAIVKLAEEEFVWFIKHHQIIADALSTSLIFNNVSGFYFQALDGHLEDRVKLPAFQDFVKQEQEYRRSPRYLRAEAFWRGKLANRLAPVTFYGRPASRFTTRVQRVVYDLDPELSAKLKVLAAQPDLLARTPDASLFGIFAAVMLTYVYRVSGQRRLSIGVPFHGRRSKAFKETIGSLMQVFPVQFTIDENETFLSLIRKVRAETFETMKYSQHTIGNPLQNRTYEVVVNYLTASRSAFGNARFKADLMHTGYGNESLSLQIRDMSKAGVLSLDFDFDCELFDEPQRSRAIGHFLQVLDSFVTAYNQPLLSARVLTIEEERQLITEFNPARVSCSTQTFARLFETQVERTPHNIAVAFGDQGLTYKDLNRRANLLGHQLVARGVGADVVVGLLMQRGVELLTAILGVMKAGGAYLPLDPQYPAERSRLIVTQSRVPLVLIGDGIESDSTVALRNWPAGETVEPRAEIVEIKFLLGSNSLDHDGQPSADSTAGDRNLPVRNTSANLAYVIYTSGSTGTPKGAMIDQRGMVNHLNAKVVDLKLTATDILAQTASQSFDISVWQFLAGLMVGAKVLIIGEEAVRDPQLLVTQLFLGQVTVWETVPSILRAVLEQVSNRDLRRMKWLQWLVVTGEALDAELCRQWHEQRDNVAIVNAYGPTECSDDVTHEVLRARPRERERGAKSEQVPIGKPVQNTEIYIVDELIQLVPAGVAGELVVGGFGVGRGYLHDAELTAERFIPNPFRSESGARLYKTGDLGRHLPDGRIKFIGRRDHQVKVRGFRIELGEIEATFDEHSAIKQSVVLVSEDPSGPQHLIAYLVSNGEHEPALSELRSYLKVRLPEYMMPSVYVWLAELPLTANGKVDRGALPAAGQGRTSARLHVAPRTPVEELLAQIWSELLHLDQVSMDDNFFESGGHSLLATQVISRVREVFQSELGLRALFEAPTIAQLAQRIEAARSGQSASLSQIVAVDRVGPLPLSFAQQRLWFLDQLEPGGTVYNLSFAARLEGQLDSAALERSFSVAVARHEVLRTIFKSEEGRPVQVIVEARPVRLETIDLGGMAEGELEGEVGRLVKEEGEECFDLAEGPLMRVKLVRVSEAEHVLLVTMHHIISDGWSMGVLVREVAQLYEGFSSGQGAALPELEIQYGDYAVWQREWLQGEVLEEQLGYWREQLRDAPGVLELPGDRGRGRVQSYRGGYLPLSLDAGLTAELKGVSERAGVTMFMTLLAAFQVLLGRYSGAEEVVVGTPIANRTRAETEGLIGFFVNLVALRTRLRAGESWEELLGRVREVCLGAYGHQEVPFEKLVEELQPERALSHHPLFQVLLVLQNAPVAELKLRGLRLELVETELTTAKFDLTLGLEESGGGLRGSLGYSSDLFERETMARLMGHYERLLRELSRDPEQIVSRTEMLSAAERGQVLWEWNQTRREYELETCLHHLFEAQAERTPGAVAVVGEGRQLSYGELNGRANQLAHYLRGRGVGAETVVGLCLERSVEMVVTLLAVLKAGGAYLPLDVNWPEGRLNFMIADAGARVLVTRRAEWPGYQRHVNTRPDLARLLTPAVSGEGGREVVWLDEEWEQITGESRANPEVRISGRNLAYVIYTSGSTGRPKGVMIEHRQMVNYLRGISERVGLHSGSRYLMVQPLTVDSSATTIYPSLSGGGSLHVAGREQGIDGEWLASYIREQEIDCLKIAPSHLKALVQEVGVSGLLPREQLIMGGEASQWEFVRQLQAEAGQCRLYNHYGPTEATVGVLVKELGELGELGEERVGGSEGRERGVVGLGRGLANVRVYVLDEELGAVAVGVVGELYLGGECVGRGYLGRSEQTAARFVPDPYSEGGGERLYRTGDLGRYGRAGEIEFVGRRDDQVKVRGHRIELGEVEGVLSEAESVREAAVVVRADQSGEPRLVAYVVVAGGGAEEERRRALRQHLKEHLPEHMMPWAIVELAALPLSAHGKVDRRALPAPAQERLPPPFLLAPRSLVEELLSQIWCEVLQVEAVSIDDNFFELGGHSLLATQVISRVHHVFDQELPLRTLFEAPSIALFAQRIEAGRGEARSKGVGRIPTVSRSQPLPLSFAQQRLWFLDQLEPYSGVYNIAFAARMEGELEIPALEQSLSEVVARHEVLRTTFRSENGRPVQVIAQPQLLPLVIIDLRGLAVEERERQLDQIIKAAATAPFDLENGPLLRMKLLRLAKADHVLLGTMHHIISDGWSMGVLIREVATLYEAFSGNQRSPLAELEIQYADYAVWQRERLQGERLEQQLSYWREQLADAPAVLELPTDRPRSPVPSYRGAHLPVVLDGGLTAELKGLSQRAGVTLFMTLLTAFNALLFRSCAQSQIVVGTLLANRTRREIEPLIGFFLNAQPLLTSLSSDMSWLKLMSRVREVAMGAYAHQDVPFEKLVEELRPEREVSHHPLFQVMLVLQNAPREELELKGLKLRMMEMEAATAVVDLTLSMRETSDGLSGWIEYSTELFEAQTIDRLNGHFQRLLEAMVKDPEGRISAAQMLSESEREQLLWKWNQTDQEYPRDVSFHRLFEDQAASTPWRIAVTCGQAQLTYGELNRRANDVARHLRARGIGPEQVVGLLLERSIEYLIGMLGVFKAGGVYLPLDRSMPGRRLREVLERSGAQVVLSRGALLDEMAEQLALSRPGQSGRLMAIEDLLEGPAPVGTSTSGDDLAKRGNLAYIIYTSGSTGIPKGVMITQQGMLNHLWAKVHDLQLDRDDVLAETASPGFDISVWQFLAALLVGGQVLIVGEEETRDPHLLVAQMRHGGVTVWESVPSMVRAVVDQVSGQQLEQWERLRWLVVTGEALEMELCRDWMKRRGNVKMVNAYGPTECSDDVTHEIIGVAECADERGRVAIGRPVQNTRVYVVDEELEIVGAGVVGEIVIGGEGVGRGYVGDGKETAWRFVPDGFSGKPGARLYRTGDMGKRWNDGRVEYVGRRDQQVKIRGYRIELGEVEAVLREHQSVKDAVAIVREDVDGQNRIVAYVVGAGMAEGNGDSAERAAGELRDYLKERLPEYMVPSVVLQLAAMPLTPNGKVDRRALPAPEPTKSEGGKKEAAGNAVEEVVAGIWREVLSVGEVGRGEDFFELGGHSLLATQVISRMREAFEMEIPLRKMFETPTVAGLATAVFQNARDETRVIRTAQLLLRIAELSDQEVETMLSDNGSSPRLFRESEKD